ncbi:candidapepsin-4 precursor [Corynespora cassiicola Philippines]|uniref:Probable aspartic-type endopeptidase OPSB n=1 Tax=Corynespora cassiicola Philippines TaxID=1448308 RepID=A0A2T2NTU0_CORCC|nr:candidapepsin-4 precursor [Corynespora cassiicola Philippines]
MKCSALVFAAQLVTLVPAFKLVKRENPRVFGLDIQRRQIDSPLAHDRLRRRQKTVQQTLDNLETLYFANASLGTPEQTLRLHIDTGSSDLWANAADNELCSSSREDVCVESGTYDANSSSTYTYVNSDFNISYVDGSGASGDYATDTFRFGGKTINDLQFGIGYVSSSPEGILGIGYTINEVQVNRAGGQPYPNLPQKLADDGDINVNAYSLWLNDLDASTGSILFGGVDSAKYSGTLSRLPIIPERGGVYAEFIIAMTALGQNGNEGSIFNDQAVPVLLDSGSSLMYLPDNVVRSLYTTFSAQYDSSQGAAFVDCDLANQDGSLEFTFSGVSISVPMNELVLTAAYTRGQPVCILGISPAGDSVAVLGDTFLRSAYVVYDLSNNEIALAQTNFNATESNVQEIQSGDDGVPDATEVANAVSSIPVGTVGGRINGPTINPTGGNAQSTGAAMPAITASPWLGAGAAVAGAGVILGFNGF